MAAPLPFQTNAAAQLHSYSPLFHRPDLGVVDGFSQFEYAYKEYRTTWADCGWCKGAPCRRCQLRGVCDGFHKDYAEMFGYEEAVPVTDLPETIYDPRFYMREQMKVVEDEEWGWVRESYASKSEGVDGEC